MRVVPKAGLPTHRTVLHNTFELSKPIDLSGHEAWYDVEDNCFVDEDLCPFPPLEQEDLASTEAQG